MESYKEGTSMTRPPRLDSSNYGYWKVRMQAFISGLDEDCWNSIEVGWNPPTMIDEKKEVVLKPRDKWTDAEKRQSSCNSKAKTAIYNAIDAKHFKLISQCVSAQKAWKTLENMFEGTTSVKRTKLDMLASKFETLRMGEGETVAEFSAKLCDISNESFALGKQYKDKKLVKKLKRSLPSKFESKISAVEEAHNLDEMGFDEFVGILQAFELSKLQASEEKKKEDSFGIALKSSSAEDPMAMLSRQFAKYLKQKEKKYGKDEELGKSSRNVQCYECKGFGHVRSKCANLLESNKKKAMNAVTSDSETDSEDDEDMNNFVAFTSFSSDKSESASGFVKPASERATGAVSKTVKSATESDTESDSDVEPISDEEFAENYKKLYEHWLKLVEENAVLTKENMRLETLVAEERKLATEKEEEATQTRVQLEETLSNLRMLNNGTKKLDHILSLQKSNGDRHGLGFKGKISKSASTFVSDGKITSASETDTETATATKTATGTGTATGKTVLCDEPRRNFRHVCHHCGVVGHIRPRCFRLLRERSEKERAYGVRSHVPTCYHCGVQGHIQRNCFRFLRDVSYEGPSFRKMWVRKDDLHGKREMGYQPRFGKRGFFSN